MKVFIEIGNGQVGFGATKEEAMQDLHLNLCRESIENDTTGEFTKRRDELYAWLPKPNMLHVNGIGCITYNDGVLTNTKTGKSIQVNQHGGTMYYYLANILGKDISYTDITVSLQKEFDTLFQSISPEFTLIKDMPYIRLSDEDNGFDPVATYVTDDNVIIGVADKEIGMKLLGDEMYHTVELDDNNSYVPLLSYIGYKIGVVFSDEGVELIG